MRRELWQTITELAESLAVPQAESLNLRVTGMSIDLPIETVVVLTDVGFQLLVDAPHYRWDVGFRQRPGRLQIELREWDLEQATMFGQP